MFMSVTLATKHGDRSEMNYPERVQREEVDGSRLTSLNQQELKQLLAMRVEVLTEDRADNCTANLHTWSKPVVEVLNALMTVDTRPRRKPEWVPLFLPPLYEE